MSEFCDLPCQDQEEWLYSNPPFVLQRKGTLGFWACGGHASNVFSAFRQSDGVSALGRRGAFSPEYATWYEAVVVELPDALQRPAEHMPSAIRDAGRRWTLFGSHAYYLHAVHIDTGRPVFSHQSMLPFAPECLRFDGVRGHVLALARTINGGLDLVTICPGCAAGEAKPMIKFLPIFDASSSSTSAFVAAMPACAYDAFRRSLAFTARPATAGLHPDAAGDDVRLVEVDVFTGAVTWRHAAPLAHAVTLEQCNRLHDVTPNGPSGFTAVVVSPGGPGGEFRIAYPDTSSGSGQAKPAEQLPDCATDFTGACTDPGPPNLYVQMSSSAAHASLPAVFVATEAGALDNGSNPVGENESARLAHIKCDSKGFPATLWPAQRARHHRRRGIILETPFSRLGSTGLTVPAPRLWRAELSSGGRRILVTFDAPTLMGALPLNEFGDSVPDLHDPASVWPAIFSCSLLFDDPTIDALGLWDADGTNCSWASTQVAVVRLGPLSPAHPGQRVFVRSGVVYAFIPGRGYSPPSSGGVYLLPPPNIRPPQVVMSGPEQVDSCTDIEIDASSSVDDTGEMQMRWSLVAASCKANSEDSSCNLSAIEEQVRIANASGLRVLRLEPSSRPPRLASIEVEVSVRSRWNLEDSTRRIVTVQMDAYIPAVEAAAFPEKTTSADGATLRGSGSLSPCHSRQKHLVFSWELAAIAASELASTDEAVQTAVVARAWRFWNRSVAYGWNSSLLQIPPFGLTAGVRYSFKFEVKARLGANTASAVGLTSELPVVAFATVDVVPSPLIIQFVQPLVSAVSSDDIEVDVKPSFDPDRPTDLLPEPSWRCEAVTHEACTPVLMAALAQKPKPCPSDKSGLVACRPRPSALWLRGGVFAPSSRSRLVASVTADITRAAETWQGPPLAPRSAEAGAEVLISEASMQRRLNDGASWVSGNRKAVAWVLPLQRPKVGAHEALRVEGFGARQGTVSVASTSLGLITPMSNLTFRWQVERLEPNPLWDRTVALLQGDSYTVPKKLFAAVPRPMTEPSQSTSMGSAIAFQPYALVPGSRYRFVLSVFDSTLSSGPEALAAAEVEVVQTRPLPGLLTAAPKRGHAALTVFELSATQWAAEDEALPLMYAFGFSADFMGRNPTEVRLAAPSSAARLRTRSLGAGESQNLVQLFVEVYTALGGGAKALTTVEVFPSVVDQEEQIVNASRGDPVAALPGLAVALLFGETKRSLSADGWPAHRFHPASRMLSTPGLAAMALGVWSSVADALLGGLEDRITDGDMLWPSRYLGLTLVGLLGALRIIFRGLETVALQRRYGLPAVERLLALALPDEGLEQVRRATVPGCWPPALLQPNSALLEVVLRAVGDVIFNPKAAVGEWQAPSAGEGNAPEDSLEALVEVQSAAEVTADGSVANETAEIWTNTTGETQLVLFWSFRTFQLIFQALLQRFVPFESYSLVTADFAFIAGRQPTLATAPVRLAPIEVDALIDAANPTGWLWVTLGEQAPLGFPVPPPATATGSSIEAGNSSGLRRLADSVVGTLARLAVAFVAISDSYGRPRHGDLAAFGALMEALDESPASSCFEWGDGRWQGDQKAAWLSKGLTVDDRGACITALTENKSSALLGLFIEATQLAQGLPLAESLSFAAPPLGGLPRVMVGFSGAVALLAIQACSSCIARLRQVSSLSKSGQSRRALAPSDWPVRTGYLAVRVIDDVLVYGLSFRWLGFFGVSLPRSWLAVSFRTHLFLGLVTTDLKVSLAQKVSALLAALSAACGITAFLHVRAFFLPLPCVFLAGILACPLGLIPLFMFEFRPWTAPFLDSGDQEVQSWQEASAALGEHDGLMRKMAKKKQQALPVLPGSSETSSGPSTPSVRSTQQDALSLQAALSLVEEGHRDVMGSSQAGWQRIAWAPPGAIPEETAMESNVGSPGPASELMSSRTYRGSMQLLPSARGLAPTTLRPRSPSRRGLALSPQSGGAQETDSLAGFFSISPAIRATRKDATAGSPPIAQVPHHSCRGSADNADRPDRATGGRSYVSSTAPAACLSTVRSTSGGLPHSLSWRIQQRFSVPAAADLASPVQDYVGKTEMQMRQLVPADLRRDCATFSWSSQPTMTRFLADLRYEEQALQNMRGQLESLQARHVTSLQGPPRAVEEAREDLPAAAARISLLLGYAASLCIAWTGCAVTVLYQVWLFSSVQEALLFHAMVVGSWCVAFCADTIRTGVITLSELVRLERRRMESQAEWFSCQPQAKPQPTHKHAAWVSHQRVSRRTSGVGLSRQPSPSASAVAA
eukprot:TRINITY_DN35390_c0_g2_i1.p1 TRINITY_DN35390_c0_g2~~TRINITY_DN35390_c0_g2_i1.p1  ORF type:complete len:2275 (-),score=328.21 TRINITY_DN35390_c0_g2_i1:86-6910(-)